MWPIIDWTIIKFKGHLSSIFKLTSEKPTCLLKGQEPKETVRKKNIYHKLKKQHHLRHDEKTNEVF